MNYELSMNLIVCFAFIFLASSGCSKEDSPYTREQIIGKWVENSYMEVDKYGNETWIEIPEQQRYFYQFNANGTFFTKNMPNDMNSSWKLKGNIINAKAKDPFSDRIIDYVFNISSIYENELITNVYDASTNMKKIKYVKEKDSSIIKTDL